MTTILTIDELFTPKPSGVGGNPNIAAPAGSWLADQLTTAAIVGLPTTAWQPGQPERSIMSVNCVSLAQFDGIISLIAQGGFLNFAASGTVLIPGNDPTQPSITVPVTPDPSNIAQNPTGAPGWLDEIGQGIYDEERFQASYASGALAIVNTNVGSAGPYDVGTYHVANTRTQATYKNTATLPIPSSRIAGTGGVITAVTSGSVTSITTQTAHGVVMGDIVYVDGVGGITSLNGTFSQVASTPTTTTLTLSRSTTGTFTTAGTLYLCTVADFEADVIGIGSNAAPGDVTSQVTQLNGIGTSNVTAWSAANYESNADYAERCRLKLGAVSPDGAAQAYEYFALSAFRLLAEEDPPIALTNGPIASANAFGSPQTGEVNVVVASTSPASTVLGEAVTPGCVALDVTDASNATPIVITSLSPHGLLTGNVATIEGVLGNISANGTWTITKITASTFSLDGSAGVAAYTGGGQIDGGDLGQVDRIIQSNCVDDNAIAFTSSALALPITISAVVIVPTAFKAVYTAALSDAFTQFLKTQDIGGGADSELDYTATLGEFFTIGVQVAGGTSYVRDVQNFLLNGGTSNVAFPSPQYQAILGTLTVSVVGV